MLLDRPGTVMPTADEAELAAEASRLLLKRTKQTLRVRLEGGEELVLPRAATRLLTYLLAEMSQGNAVTLIPVHAELTTQQAADFLNVSRPHLIQLLEEGRIAFHKVGTHRRVKFKDLQTFRDEFEQTRRARMEELAAEAQELGMGY